MASAKLPDKLADMLARVKATGLSDQEVHERASLSSGWLTQARQGRYGLKAPSVKKLERWLKRFEAGASDAPEPEPAPIEDAEGDPATLIARAIVGGARTHAEVAVVERRLAAGILTGLVDESRGELALSALKGLKQSIVREREENASATLRALELLTPDEEAVLAAYRSKLAGPPTQPGVYVAPPATP